MKRLFLAYTENLFTYSSFVEYDFPCLARKAMNALSMEAAYKKTGLLSVVENWLTRNAAEARAKAPKTTEDLSDCMQFDVF